MSSQVCMHSKNCDDLMWCPGMSVELGEETTVPRSEHGCQPPIGDLANRVSGCSKHLLDVRRSKLCQINWGPSPSVSAPCQPHSMAAGVVSVPYSQGRVRRRYSACEAEPIAALIGSECCVLRPMPPDMASDVNVEKYGQEMLKGSGDKGAVDGKIGKARGMRGMVQVTGPGQTGPRDSQDQKPKMDTRKRLWQPIRKANHLKTPDHTPLSHLQEGFGKGSRSRNLCLVVCASF
ncbi:uncharacterized protein P884DRAFT_293818 [Thermothelomyces heterothallicus CBS 202.75]|uniref:uncharacterized protein n=1 Tax=Thermothelomyces heterothallicus CBS 202.75 TaxID=1149848 RepID=UPI003743698E